MTRNRSKVSRTSSRNVTAKPLPVCPDCYPPAGGVLAAPPRFFVRRYGESFDLVDDRGSMRWVVNSLTVSDLREIRDVLQAAIDGASRGAGKERP